MQWIPFTSLPSSLNYPKGYTGAELKYNEVPELISLLRQWYPDIEVGSESCHLREEFYENEVFFREKKSSMDKDIFPLSFKKNDRIIGFMSLKKNDDARTITARLGAIAPEHRGSGLGSMGPIILETMARAMGSELAFYYATLKIPHQQQSAETAGFQLVGIVPAHDRDMIAPGITKRVYEAIYAKVLVNDNDIFLPPATSLIPNTKKLWNFLFGTTHPIE